MKKFPNKHKVFALWTDWNRKGAEGQYGGIGWYRVINPLSKIENTTIEGKFTFGTDEYQKIAEEIKSKGDIMFIKYVDSFQAVNHICTIRDIMHLKLVVDIDDNVFRVHPHNYAYKDTKPGSEAYQAFQYLFKEADALVCSTQPLKDDLRIYNDKIFVIPNGIDTDIWNVPVKKNIEKKIKIGWVYGPTHEQDVPLIVPAIKEILKKYPNVEFNHIGWKSEAFDKFAPEQQKLIFGTNGYKEFPTFLANQGMDILIAPLIDDEFNRGKSNIKFLEAAMCEIPTVCSDVYPYSTTITNGHDGYLAKTTSEWIKYLSYLIENKEKRIKMGENAKKTALKYDVKRFLPDYVKVFDELMKPEPEVSVVITRRNGESDDIALKSLERQSYSGIKEIIRIEDIHGRGQNWAKNQGLRQVKTKYVLFSDNDIKWKPWAVKKLVNKLEANPKCSYSFGAYVWNFEGNTEKHLQCNEEWSAERLKDFDRGNIVSTMSLVKTKDCPEMDEDVNRLTDWDLWLKMLSQGKTGIHCRDIIFETVFSKDGVSASKKTNYEEALNKLKEKYKTL